MFRFFCPDKTKNDTLSPDNHRLDNESLIPHNFPDELNQAVTDSLRTVIDTQSANTKKLRIMLGLNFFRDFSWTCASVLLLNWKCEPTNNVDYGLESQQFGQQILAALAMLIPVAGIVLHSKITHQKTPTEDILVSFFAAAAVIYAWDYAGVLGSEKGREWLDLTDDPSIFPNTGDFAALWTGLFEGPGQLLVGKLIQMMIRGYHCPASERSTMARDEIIYFLTHPLHLLTEIGISAMPFAGGLPGDIWQLVYNRLRQFNTLTNNINIDLPRTAITATAVASSVMAANYGAAKITDRMFRLNHEEENTPEDKERPRNLSVNSA